MSIILNKTSRMRGRPTLCFTLKKSQISGRHCFSFLERSWVTTSLLWRKEEGRANGNLKENSRPVALSLSPTSLRPLCCIVDRGCGLPCESTSKTNRLNRGTEILSSSAARAGSEQNKVSQRDSPSIHKHPTGTPCRDRNVKMQYKERTQVP